MSSSKIVIDIQCFRVENNKLLVKELAAYNGERYSHYVFKPPFSLYSLPIHLRNQVTWLSHNHHCVDWLEGFTSVHKFQDILHKITEDAEQIYVKGFEKAAYIEEHVSKPVYRIEDHPPIEAREPSCFHHTKSPCICALSNVIYLYKNLKQD